MKFLLDGAEEQATYVIDGPDRWRTVSTGPERVVVYYARRR